MEYLWLLNQDNWRSRVFKTHVRFDNVFLAGYTRHTDGFVCLRKLTFKSAITTRLPQSLIRVTKRKWHKLRRIVQCQNIYVSDGIELRLYDITRMGYNTYKLGVIKTWPKEYHVRTQNCYTSKAFEFRLSSFAILIQWVYRHKRQKRLVEACIWRCRPPPPPTAPIYQFSIVILPPLYTTSQLW